MPSASAGLLDSALLTAWADRGDEAAFAALVERHVRLVHGVALRRLGDDHAAKEVTQTVFAIMARKAPELKPVRVLAAWLHRVTAVQSARAIRQLVRDRRMRESAMQHLSLHSDGRDPLAEALPLLDKALDSLPERDRTLLILRYSEGVSFAEASARTGRSEAALRQQAGRAVERLASALRRKGVSVPAAALTGGLAATLGGGGSPVSAAEVARSALTAAPAVTGGALFLTSLLTMSTLKTTLLGGAAALLLTGLPAVWQGMELGRLRAAAVSPPAAAWQKQTAAGNAASLSSLAGRDAKRKAPRSAGTPPATLNMEAIGKAVANSMDGLLHEAAGRMATVEARRAAVALGFSPEAEAALRRRVVEIWEKEFESESGTHTHEEEAESADGENFQQRTRRLMEEHLSASATPEQVDRWRTLRRQREETEIEKVAADAFHATARLVDLTGEQKDALFKKCSEAARELYASNWKNSFSAGAAISPRVPEPLENDEGLLREILTSEQFADWQSQSSMQREFYDGLPRRVIGRVFSVVSGDQLAEAIRKDLPEAGSTPAGTSNTHLK